MNHENLQEELSKMAVEDLDRGWSEALEIEYNKLTRQFKMATEELHLKRVQLRHAVVRAAIAVSSQKRLLTLYIAF